MDSLPAEPQGKPKNTGEGSLSLSPVDLSNSGIKLGSTEWQVYLPTKLLGKPYYMPIKISKNKNKQTKIKIIHSETPLNMP